MPETPRTCRAALLAALLVAACQSAACGDDGPSCPDDLPASCPEPAPSYQDEVAPILDAVCVPCHGPGGQEQSRPLTSYQDVFDARTDVLSQVYGCRMPPRSADAQLEPDERQTLLAWLVCGAPDN